MASVATAFPSGNSTLDLKIKDTKEAISNGDKILSENYLQHADHFARILQSREVAKETNLNSSFIEETKSENAKQGEINNEKNFTNE